MAALTEPMFQPEAKEVNSGTSRSGKFVALSCLLIGLTCTMLLNGMATQQPSVQDPAASLAVMQPTRAFMQPTKVMQPNGYALAKMYGIGNSEVEQLAMKSIEVVNRRSRDVSMGALPMPEDEGTDLGNRLSNFLESTIEAKNMSEMVVLKANEMAGVTPPTDFFDPLGFSTDISAGKLLFYREVELKHGRVGMLAALGILVGENFHPMFGGQIDVPAYIAFQETPLQKFWFLVVTVIAIPEMFSVFTFDQVPGANPRAPNSGAWWSIRADHEPGNFGFDPLNLRPTDAKEYREMQNKELNNGRLAMIAAAGMIAQELVTGKKIFER